jgi:RNA polymerase sigma factor (sigma-70 family)
MATKMDPVDQDQLAAVFEGQRTHLRAVAYRMLGSVHEADDAVQEAWLRLSRSDVSEVANLPAWLTTVVSRLCLDQLRSRGNRREVALPEHDADADLADAEADPLHDALLADQVGSALQVVLDTLSPAERLAFVLHDLFAVPFDEIGSVMGRSSAAVRQLASRARRRVQSADDEQTTTPAERRTQREVVEAFLTASRDGDLQGLVEVLDPDAVVRADAAAVAMGSRSVVSGVEAVAQNFSGRAVAAQLVDIDGYAGMAWSPEGRLTVAFGFVLTDGRISEIELIADPEVLTTLDVSRGSVT